MLHYVDSDELSFRVPWVDLMKELESKGAEQVLLCRPGGNMERAARERGVKTRTWRPFASSVPPVNLRYPSIVRSISPDIVHTRLSSAAAMAGWWGGRLGIPTIATLDKVAKSKYYLNADHYVSCSRWIKDYMVSLGLQSEKIDIVYNSVDIDRYRRDEGARKEFRGSHGIGDEERAFIGVGRFDSEKSFDVLIRAFAIASGDSGGTRLLLVGDGSLRGDYLKLIGELGLSGKVIMTDGFVDDVRPWLWGADYYVMPSRMEPFGIAMLEAMASGLPSIVSDSGGLREIIMDRGAGIVAPAGDVSAFAGAMSKMLGMGPEAAEKMASNAMTRLSDFTSGAVADKMMGVYEKVLRCGSPKK
ncbi:MAG: glycosyltransferase family 4 protein [Synergistaceae bacterium]|nr:glycosyltransferase family 4 protein [Synergistaceae bacterium]